MKTLFIFLYFLMLFAAPLYAASSNKETSQRYNVDNEVDSQRVTIDRKTGNRIFEGSPFSGISVSRYANGQVSLKEQFLNGRRHGVLKRWFQDGTLGFESHYHLGRREGLSKSWWSSGKKRSENTYINDKVNGLSREWYRSGEQFKQYNFVAGQPTGLQKAWRKNGKLYSNFEYRNGRTYGLRNSNLCITLKDETIIY